MKFFLSILLFLTFALPTFAQVEEEGVFSLDQNPLAPGQAPINDERLAPGKESSGIILPEENSDLPLEAAIAFGDKKQKSPISKDFILGFTAGGAFIFFVAFFMLKFSKKERGNQ